MTDITAPTASINPPAPTGVPGRPWRERWSGAAGRLPTARAALGALLVVGAAVITLSVAGNRASVPTSPYLVTTHAVRAGERIAPGDLAPAPLVLTPELAAAALASAAGTEGAVALRDLPAGSLVTVHDLVAAPDTGDTEVGAVQELTLPVPLDRAPASLLPGERVTILSTVDEPERTETRVAVADALVVEYGPRRDDLAAIGTAVLTLALDDARTAAEVAHLSRIGELTVIRSTRAVGAPWPSRVTLDETAGGSVTSVGAEDPPGASAGASAALDGAGAALVTVTDPGPGGGS